MRYTEYRNGCCQLKSCSAAQIESALKQFTFYDCLYSLFYISDDEIGPTLIELRNILNLKVTDCSKALDIPYRTLQDWEYGKRVPTKQSIERIVASYVIYVGKGQVFF